MLELEHQRYQKDRVREEHQCREERQFQMELYAMMCGIPRPTYGTLPFPCPSSHGSPLPRCIMNFTFNLVFLESLLLMAVLHHLLSLKMNNNINYQYNYILTMITLDYIARFINTLYGTL